VWRFRLLEPLVVELGPGWPDLGDVRAACDASGRPWLTLGLRTIVVHAGYAWNGASPKRRVFGLWLGTPDFLCTRRATAVHDALGQFAHLPAFPLDFAAQHRLLREVIAAEGSPVIGELFYAMLVLLNPAYRLAGTLVGAQPSGVWN